MSTFKMIIAGIGTAVGVAFLIFMAVVAWKIKGVLTEKRNEKDIADSVRFEGLIANMETRLASRDSVARITASTFLVSRDRSRAQPIVTGGGKHADSVANAAVQACFDEGVKALTACQVARITADSVPILRDSLSTIEKRLIARQNPRWTARGLAGYAWPMKTPAIGVESDLRGPFSITLNARADAIPFYKPATRADSLAYGTGKWRATTSIAIPFR